MMASHLEATAPTVNPGETLRLAREQKNWTLAAVAQQLNLSERAVAQIEAGDFSQLPGHTFARGYIRAYAKLLGLDQNRLVQEFDRHTGTDASGASVNSLGRIDEPVRLSHNIMRFFTFALLLIVAGAAFYWWQDQRQRAASGPSVTALERIEVEAADGTTEIHLLDRAEEPLEPEPQEPLAESETAMPQLPDEATTEQAPAPSITQPLPLGEGQPAVQPEAPAAAAAPTTPVAPPQPEVAAPAAPAADVASAPQAPAASPAAEQPVAAVAAPAAGEGLLELRFSADCWTRVTDADGKVLFSGLAKAGSSRSFTAKAPIDLHLGFASGVQVSYNGEAVSLAGKTRGETARLKLGQ